MISFSDPRHNALLTLGVAVFGFVGVSVALKRPRADQDDWKKLVPQTEAAPRRVAETRNPWETVRLNAFRWEKAGFGNVFVVSFQLTNINNFPVKDLTLACSITGASGTQLSTPTKVIYEQILPGGTIVIRDLNMGFMNDQGSSAACLVWDFKR